MPSSLSPSLKEIEEDLERGLLIDNAAVQWLLDRYKQLLKGSGVCYIIVSSSSGDPMQESDAGWMGRPDLMVLFHGCFPQIYSSYEKARNAIRRTRRFAERNKHILSEAWFDELRIIRVDMNKSVTHLEE